MEKTLRVSVIADDALARAGLVALLASQPNIIVASQGSNSPISDFLNETDEPIDVVIWDYGWETAPFDIEEGLTSPIPTIMLIHSQDQAPAALKQGARGLLYRNTTIDELVSAIEAVAAGLDVLAPGLITSLLTNQLTEYSDAAVDLTSREAEVLSLVAEGLTNKAIGQRLSISEHTVKFHVNAIMSKLEAQSRTDAVVKATRMGLISI